MKINISPNPMDCMDVPGGVNSVVVDHAAGFLAAGCEISPDGLNIVHAVAQHEQIDVFHCHGLYPIGPGYFDKRYSKANDIVLRNALKAKLTVCISEFSANILRHKLHIDPVVTRNGIWTRDYKAGGSKSGPVLFAKAALDANAKPDDMLWLRENTDVQLLSIAKIDGINSTGRLSRTEFLKTLSGCSVYLGTTKENNSMATMEALIMGVPVVGYDIGFNREWLQSGVGCELVPYGDQFSLRDALLKVQSNWKVYSRQARDFAQRFDWKPVINQLLDLYQNINKAPESNAVSIVIPCHNYSKWIGTAIESALAQTVPCEIIVVDDFSTDGSAEIAERYPVNVIRNTKNIGVAETRNSGIAAAKGRFIVCLDADDRIDRDFVEVHQAGLAQSDLDCAIAYAPIRLVDRDGHDRNQTMFNGLAAVGMQAIGRNQIPSCCMFRKTFWERAGGYDQQYSPAEDAQLWLKVFKLGGTAIRVTSKPLMSYRIHENSLSAKGFPEWWKDSTPSYNEPIQERDPKLFIEIEAEADEAKRLLWQIENQPYKPVAVSLKKPGDLEKTFPWINRYSTDRQKSVLSLSGLPSQKSLEELMHGTPAWMGGRQFP